MQALYVHLIWRCVSKSGHFENFRQGECIKVGGEIAMNESLVTILNTRVIHTLFKQDGTLGSCLIQWKK